MKIRGTDYLELSFENDCERRVGGRNPHGFQIVTLGERFYTAAMKFTTTLLTALTDFIL
jgi:hypothetical protein